MGREIRKVPKDWEHPKNEYGEYKPMFEESYLDKLQEWVENHLLWLKGDHPDQKTYPEDTKDLKFYAEWSGNPPDINTYNPNKWSEKEAACFQIYENVTEGTPISPVFDTLRELKDWLVKTQGFEREAAEKFCEQGWAPSFTGFYKTDASDEAEQHNNSNLPEITKKLMEKILNDSINQSQQKRRI